MSLDYSQYDNETKLELDMYLYGLCAKDKNGNWIDVSKCRVGQNNGLIYYEENGKYEIIEATLEKRY